MTNDNISLDINKNDNEEHSIVFMHFRVIDIGKCIPIHVIAYRCAKSILGVLTVYVSSQLVLQKVPSHVFMFKQTLCERVA